MWNKKGLARIARTLLILVSLLILTLVTYNSFISAESLAQIWTADADGNSKYDFSPGDMVYIHGEEFLPKKTIRVDVTRPDNNVETGYTVSDSSKQFVYVYDLNGIDGLYYVEANDGYNTATTTFTDKSVDSECQDYGFNFGIAKYQCGSESPELGSMGSYYDITVDWDDCTSVSWTADPGVGGVISKEATQIYTHDGGTSGTINKTVQQDISHITFCGYNETEYCGDGIVNGDEECDDGNDNNFDSCDNDCKLRFINETIHTCTGDGEVFFYAGDPFQAIDVSFSVNFDELLIFTRASYISSSNLNVKINGVAASKSVVFDQSSPFPVKIYLVDTNPGDIINITGYSSRGARSIQGYLSQDSSNPVYDISSLQIVYDDALTNVMYLTPDTYDFLILDKYSIDQPGADPDFRKVNVVVSKDSNADVIYNNTFNQPYPPFIEGGVLASFSILSEESYTLGIDSEDSVYWPLVNCSAPEPYCGDGIVQEELGEECDDGNNDNGDGCDENCTNELCYEVDCSYLDTECQEGVCDPSDGECYPDYSNYPLSTPCELDDDECTIDHCNGEGSCVWKEDVVVPAAEECLEYYCDPVDGEIKEDYTNYPLSTPCELDDDECTIDHCDGEGSCVWKEDVVVPAAEECLEYYCDPVDGEIKENYTNYPLSTPCELDDDECTIDHCDGEGSCVWKEDVEVPAAEECLEYYCDPEDGEIKEEYYPLSTPCETDQDVCALEHCDGIGLCVINDTFYQNLSIPNKVVGEPKTICEEEEWCEWRITVETPITLSCENNAQVKWRYALDGDWKEWHIEDSPVIIHFPEESQHILEAFCISNCSEGPIDSEKFKVEGTKFEIPLFKKWNLISVPFTLLNDDPDVVFNNTPEVESVWAYDPEHVICGDDWCVWTSESAPDDLRIKPGWGYWVLVNEEIVEEPLWLVIGGSLMSPAQTPPSRNLVQGWNLIGYYGTSWELYNWSDFNFQCGDAFEFPDRALYGDKVYCSLNSLIDTQAGYPRWGSLWSYLNCGDHNAFWLGLNACADQSPQQIFDRMYAGRGYWVEMDVEDMYAPATTCIWNSGFECRWTGGGVIP